MSDVSEVVAAIFMLFGAALLLLAALGLVRMPDVYTRLSAASKAVALGAGSLFISVAIIYPDPGVTTRAVAGIFFILLTAPVAAHALARAAARVGSPLWAGTVANELGGYHGDAVADTALRDEDPRAGTSDGAAEGREASE
jgi:multicomponent Na+:H+ antiporter subunit G